VLTCKADPSGDPREIDVVNKFRISMSEGGREDLVSVETHSLCTDDITNRLVTLVAPTLKAHQTSIDVGGAYFHGTPPTMEEGGRMVYAVVPEWLQDFGPYRERNPDGSRNLLRIIGNMPGRCDAGRIWQRHNDKFLQGYGLRQTLTDRRLWVIRNSLGTLLLHDHVDDSRLTATTAEIRSHFYRAWAAAFDSPPEPLILSENFTGLRHQRTGEHTTEISCLGVIRSLQDLIAPYPMRAGTPHDVPLPADALSRLRDGASDRYPLRPDLVPIAQRIAGTIGFITNQVRPDAHFAYCVLARYLSEPRMTQRVFDYLIRVGTYLVSTKDLCLTLTSPSISCGGLDLFDIHTDSSMGNVANGLSQGGFVLLSRGQLSPDGSRIGGGAFAWKCEAPEEGDDSSGAAELRMVTRALKYAVAIRTTQRDLQLGIAPISPTIIHTDAESVVSGRGAERIAKSSRWLATRYAMIRWAERCKTARLAQIASEDNCADIMTKCLTGPLFLRHRARVLGLGPPHGV